MFLFNANCLASCPQGYRSNGAGGCTAQSNPLNDTLTSSLTTGAVFPLPFTITGSIIFVACFMSKLQNKNTYILGVAYALYGVIETGCLVFTILKYEPKQDSTDFKVFLIAALLAIAALNLFGLVVQSCQLARD
jgi:hypothetical protein